MNKVTVLVLSDNFSCVLSTLQCVYWRGNVAWATARPASKSTLVLFPTSILCLSKLGLRMVVWKIPLPIEYIL